MHVLGVASQEAFLPTMNAVMLMLVKIGTIVMLDDLHKAIAAPVRVHRVCLRDRCIAFAARIETGRVCSDDVHCYAHHRRDRKE